MVGKPGQFILFTVLILVCITSLPVNGEIFRWMDAEGNAQFGDRPPPSRKAERVEVNVNSYESVTIEPFVPFKSERPSRGKSVILYSTTWCGYCRKARNYLRENKIPFTEYDVEKSEKGKSDYRKLNGSGVPILLIGDKRMNGFSIGRFKKIYEG